MKLDDPGPKIDETDISIFEAINGLSLPEDYRFFLRNHNGGIPYPNAFLAPSGVEVSVSRLYSINANNAFDDLGQRCWSDAWKNSRYEGVIQIGYDAGGQELMLHTRGNLLGCVYLIIKNNAYLCAHSFTEFVDHLDRREGLIIDEATQLMDRIFGRMNE